MLNNEMQSTAPWGGAEARVYVRGAAALLRARGAPLNGRAVSRIARLARSFAREGMGPYEALSSAATLIYRR
jgi:hypothetical protein